MTKITTENIDQIHCISVQGEIDAGSSIYLDNSLKEAMDAGEKKIIVVVSKSNSQHCSYLRSLAKNVSKN